MTLDKEKPTAADIVDAEPRRETYIGYTDWEVPESEAYWEADYLYLRKKVYFEYLDKMDSGIMNGPKWYNTIYITSKINQDLAEILSQNLELTGRQQTKAKRNFKSLNLSKWGIEKEKVLWAICAYIVHSDENDTRNTHPQSARENIEDQFLEVSASLGMSRRERIQTYGKVQSYLN